MSWILLKSKYISSFIPTDAQFEYTLVRHYFDSALLKLQLLINGKRSPRFSYRRHLTRYSLQRISTNTPPPPQPNHLQPSFQFASMNRLTTGFLFLILSCEILATVSLQKLLNKLETKIKYCNLKECKKCNLFWKT